MDFIISQKDGPHGRLIVITDEDLLGKSFEQDNLQLDLTKPFYNGVKKTRKEVLALVRGAQHLHLTGKAAVALGVEFGLIDAEKIIYVKGIPHAEMVQGG
ncbi:MAG TPA: DUF424 family protein [Candidatus Nanoarchaeia archaeon]|nr:DUF424 family protein [Candidatus Nanoarchaeia archaeon]